MSEAMMQEILARLDALGEKLGIGAEMVWKTLVTQAYWVEGWFSVVVNAVGAVILLILAGGSVLYFLRRIDNPKPEEEPWMIITFLVGVGGTIGAIVLVVAAIYSVQYILNPEYYALMNLAKFIGK
jgi:heme/copper-type cytochrome/quinol oxidase subunit 2